MQEDYFNTWIIFSPVSAWGTSCGVFPMTFASLVSFPYSLAFVTPVCLLFLPKDVFVCLQCGLYHLAIMIDRYVDFMKWW